VDTPAAQKEKKSAKDNIVSQSHPQGSQIGPIKEEAAMN
jgi:hypothetical protein